MLVLTAEIVSHISEHARRAYPDECCGILLGYAEPLQVAQAIAGKNLRAASTRYLLDPRDVIDADRRAGLEGLEIIGFYHSHPNGTAYPSAEDQAQAWPDYLYLIAALSDDGATALQGWIFPSGQRRPRAIALQMLPSAAGTLES